MMPFPPFSFPMYYPRNSFYRTPLRNYGFSNNSYTANNSSQELPKENPSTNQNTSSRLAADSDTQYFEIFGIHLYFDDILILCLLFFLYQEQVTDQLLFIALLLLLLS